MSLRRFLFCLASCTPIVSTRAQSPASANSTYPDGEAAAVYRAALDALYGTVEQPPVVVLWDSTVQRISDCDEARHCRVVPPHKTAIEPSTISSFESGVARLQQSPLTPNFGYRIPVALIGYKNYEDFLRRGAEIEAREKKAHGEGGYWSGLLAEYPGAWGLTSLTRVGFNRQMTQALLQVTHSCANSCISIEDMVLAKRGARWEVVERLVIPGTTSDGIWVRTTYGKDLTDRKQVLASTRYLGPNPRMRAEFLAREDSTRRAIADSLARERAPTRLSGTVINALTGTPLSRAVVIAHSAPDDRKQRVTADAKGRFAFRNLRGGTMLEVRCPGLASREGTTLAAPGLYMRAAMDTTLTITVPNLVPCWNATRPETAHRIYRQQSTWGESVEGRSATYPAGEAEQVYHAALGAILPSPRKRTLVLANKTSLQCVRYEECGGPQLMRLITQGVVDSSTARNFIRASRDSLPIRPTFQHRGPTLYVTPADRAFLIRQAMWWEPTPDRWEAERQYLWPAFRQAYPDASGIVSITAVGFNEDTTQALVEARIDSLFEPHPVSELLLLSKESGDWRVAKRHIEREVTSGALVGGSCVPVTAPGTPPAAKSMSGILNGDFIVTSVVTSRPTTAAHFQLRLTAAEPIPGAPKISDMSEIPRSFILAKAEVVDDSAGKRPLRGHLLLTKDGLSISLSTGALDGYFEQLFPLSIKNGEFFGRWESSYGYFIQLDREMREMPNPSGYFCATRITH